MFLGPPRSPDMGATTTRNAMLSLCNNNLSIHWLSFRTLNATADTHIITLCCTNRLQVALDTFNHLLITYNLLLCSLVRRDQHESALSVNRGEVPFEETLLYIKIHYITSRYIRTYDAPTDNIPTILTNRYESATRHVMRVSNAGGEGNSAPSQVLIICHCETCRLDYAFEVFEGMEAHGHVSNFGSTKGFAGISKLSMLSRVFNQMMSKRQVPDFFTYNTLIDGLCKTGKSH
eukprot:PITA_21539